MVINDRALLAHDYYYSEEWRGLRGWLPDHPAGRALVVGYRPGGDKITFQLLKHDGTKSIRQVVDADAVTGMTPRVMNELIWYMSDTTGVDTPGGRDGRDSQGAHRRRETGGPVQPQGLQGRVSHR